MKRIKFNGNEYYFCKSRGYCISCSKIGNSNEFLHRSKWKYYRGPIPEGHVVHHIDHDKLNNKISNLQLMTHAEHTGHHQKIDGVCSVDGCDGERYAKGFCHKHYRNWYEKKKWKEHKEKYGIKDKAKISSSDKYRIIKMYQSGKKQSDIARVFNVSPQTISKHIRKWKESSK